MHFMQASAATIQSKELGKQTAKAVRKSMPCVRCVCFNKCIGACKTLDSPAKTVGKTRNRAMRRSFYDGVLRCARQTWREAIQSLTVGACPDGSMTQAGRFADSRLRARGADETGPFLGMKWPAVRVSSTKRRAATRH
jgi:hypothetical protein